MKDERISPHGNSDGVVSKGQTIRGDEQPLGARKDPDSEHQEKVDEIAKISQKVVIAFLLVGVESDWHEV